MTRLADHHFPLRHRLFRGAWMIAWALLAGWTPAPLHGWRCMVLRWFGARIGRGVRIHGSARIWYPPNLTVEDGAVVGWQVVIYCQAPIVLGRNAIVSQYAHLVAGTHDIDAPGFPLVTRPIEIGADAWVAAGAMVGPGVTLGEGAVLGARAVAFADLPAWSVHMGNPAQFLRWRRSLAEPTSPWPDARSEMPALRAHIRHR